MRKFNVKFYLKDLPDAKLLPIYASITFNADKLRLATGLTVHPANWSEGKESQFITSKDAEYKKKNAELNQHKAFLTERINAAPDGPDLKEQLKCDYNYFKKPHLVRQPKGQKTFLEYFAEWREESKTRISGVTNKALSANTLKNYRNTYQILQAFQITAPYSLSSETINEKFEQAFKYYMLHTLGQDIDTYSKHISILKVFCDWLRKKDKSLTADYKDFKRPSGQQEEVPSLTTAELAMLHNVCFLDEQMEKARLIFLTLCSTGQHITDYNQHLQAALENKKTENGHTFLYLRRQKNTRPYIIPFSDNQYFRPVYYTTELLQRYGRLPVMQEHHINKYLVYICQELGLTRIHVTSKIGRKTFASISVYALHIPAEIVMKATGHKSRRSFDVYLGIRHSDVAAAFKEAAKEWS